MNTREKPCKRCGKVKPLAHFYNNINQKDGKQTWCIDCLSEYQKKKYAQTKSNEENYYKKKWGLL